MWQILISIFISAGMIFGAQNYTEQHQTFGASQPISALTAKTSLSGNDTMVIVDNDSTPTTKKITVTNASTSFKTYNDLTYSPKFTTSAGLASILSDETGSSGGFVRAGSPTLDTVTITTSANITAPTFDVAGTDATGDIWYRNSGGLFTRLAMPSLSGYYLTGSTTLGIPQWDNNIFSNPYNATATFNGVTYVGQFMQLVSSTTINTTSGPVPVFISTSTNALVISEADVATTTDFLGFATSTNVTNGATGTVQISGIVNGFSGLTVGQPYYVSNTRGSIGSTVGTAEAYVGTAVSATQILLDRKDGNMQYLGSASCSVSSGASSGQCDIPPVSPFTRFVDVDMNGSSSGGCGTATFEGQLRIYKVGRTSASLNYASYCNSGSVGQGIGTAAFTSTSSVRISLSHGPFANVSGTQTAYFYR